MGRPMGRPGRGVRVLQDVNPGAAPPPPAFAALDFALDVLFLWRLAGISEGLISLAFGLDSALPNSVRVRLYPPLK